MLNNPYIRLVIHAIYAGVLAAVTASQTSGDTQQIITAFVGGAAAFAGYGAVSPTYKGVGVGSNDANVGGGGGLGPK